jgi:hypothetical protein
MPLLRCTNTKFGLSLAQFLFDVFHSVATISESGAQYLLSRAHAAECYIARHHRIASSYKRHWEIDLDLAS